MPRTIQYRPTLIDDLITNERLNSYTPVFHHSDDVELVGAYLWNTHVCSALHPLLTAAEVTLRNSIDTALRRDLGNFWWKSSKLHYNSFAPGVAAPHPVAALKRNFSTAAKQVKRDKKVRYGINNPIPTHHEIIAKTEFSTWEFILDSEFNGPNRIWPKHLGRVFRGAWPTHKATIMLSSSRELVKTIREFRNRVSHHEPVWKRFGVQSEADAISHLHEKIEKIRELITLVSPEKAQLILRNGLLARAERVCQIEELRLCQHSTQHYRVKSMSKLSRLARIATSENASKPITIYKHGKTRFLLQPI